MLPANLLENFETKTRFEIGIEVRVLGPRHCGENEGFQVFELHVPFLFRIVVKMTIN